jgi:hypothetical protein
VSEALRFVELALPYGDHAKPTVTQLALNAIVALPVGRGLLLPERHVALRKATSRTRVSMPKAAVNEDAPALGQVRDVRTTGKRGRSDAKPDT